MYPILFTMGPWPVHSYYLLWTAALSLAVVLARGRMTRFGSVDDDSARFIIISAFFGMLLGARLGSILDSLPLYTRDPLKLLRFWEGGLSAVPAFLGAGAAGVWASRRKGVPLWIVADSASIPAALAVSIGRWGCYLNGCCIGTASSLPWSVHFPFDPSDLSRHPVQLYYAFGTLAIAAVLYLLEPLLPQAREREKISGAVLWPLFMILYSLLRLALDVLRKEYSAAGLQSVRVMLFGISAAG
ncbi:MAG: prolipoprotein diacylglyceryl transferase, partial [Synergistaceae bacterium]|nr:prolipoprotein diacylglyceryl transferase [Synergistaceae bacterium]